MSKYQTEIRYMIFGGQNFPNFELVQVSAENFVRPLFELRSTNMFSICPLVLRLLLFLASYSWIFETNHCFFFVNHQLLNKIKFLPPYL